ncbi:MAG: C1 family peptidase, partial [Gammaproteobacteria bacterium]
LHVLPLLLSLILSFAGIHSVHAQSGEREILQSFTASYWVENALDSNQNIRQIKLDKTFLQDDELQISQIGTIVSFSISGTIKLHNHQSLVRVILIDNDLHEHLVYEAYPLIVIDSSFSVSDQCRETCLLDGVGAHSLRIELIDASIHIDHFSVIDTPATAKLDVSEIREQVLDAQQEQLVKLIQRNISRLGLRWTADSTAISRMSYAQKKRLFGKDTVPNLQGLEFYKGGIFETKPPIEPSSLINDLDSPLIESFDWRNRHGANDPDSPYYDGDPSGSGWITAVTEQGCADCWAHAAVGATEAQVNLFYNRHLDLDLSEQEALSCSGSGSCSGGSPGGVLAYIADNGIVDEDCFPYSGTDEPCANRCLTPEELIKIDSSELINPYDGEENIKRKLIDQGPLAFGQRSWWHCIVLVGYDRDDIDDETIWIIKNSWGTDWGEDGYGYIKVPLDDIYLTYALYSPVTSGIRPYDIACLDADGDGYANWGISRDKPGSCTTLYPEKDCDDSDATLGPYADNRACVQLGQVGVSIDIKPSDAANRINPYTKSVIPVAILTTSVAEGDPLDFDAMEVDPKSVRFGPDQAEAVNSRRKDVDNDGDPDLLLSFRTQQTGIACGDTEATLTGTTFSGQLFTGTDSIKTVGCKPRKDQEDRESRKERDEDNEDCETCQEHDHNEEHDT